MVAAQIHDPSLDATIELPESTGVIVVHGIGTQERESTLDCYGGAIERFWNEYQNADSRFTSSRRSRRNAHGGFDTEIRLHGGPGPVTVVECHWDPVVTEAPSILRLAYWILTVAPASLLFSCRLPSKRTDQSVRRWLLRCGFVLPILGLSLVILALAIVVLPIVRRMGRRPADFVDRVARSVGDALHFTSPTDEAQAMVDTLVDQARMLAQTHERLVVVAHSQGGAVTVRALRSPRWPDVKPHVITLGSGHNRLLTLRAFRRRGMPRLALFAWNVVALFLASTLVYGAIGLGLEIWAEEANQGEGPPFLVFLVAYLSFIFGTLLTIAIGGPMLLSQRTVSRAVSDTIKTRAASWADIWASRDIVPDGPMDATEHVSIKVVNRLSLFRDHTTYHENALEVVARIVGKIMPDRIDPGASMILEGRRAERHRRTRRFLSRLSYRSELRSQSAIAAEFAGQPVPPGWFDRPVVGPTLRSRSLGSPAQLEPRDTLDDTVEMPEPSAVITARLALAG